MEGKQTLSFLKGSPPPRHSQLFLLILLSCFLWFLERNEDGITISTQSGREQFTKDELFLENDYF